MANPLGYATVIHSAVDVTTSSGVVVAANEDRKYLLLINDSDTDIYIKLGATAVVNEGIRLEANGGHYEMTRGAKNMFTGVINGIHAGTGSKKVLVTQGT